MAEKEQMELMEVYAGTQWDVKVVQGLLKSEGIVSVIQEGMMESLSPYMDEVTLWVVPADYERAVFLINEKDNTNAYS